MQKIPTPAAKGPLEGFRIIEMAGLGPGLFCAMLLADMGAEVIRTQSTRACCSTHRLMYWRAGVGHWPST